MNWAQETQLPIRLALGDGYCQELPLPPGDPALPPNDDLFTGWVGPFYLPENFGRPYVEPAALRRRVAEAPAFALRLVELGHLTIAQAHLVIEGAGLEWPKTLVAPPAAPKTQNALFHIAGGVVFGYA